MEHLAKFLDHETNFNKFKCFCTTKETVSKVKRQPSDWESYFFYKLVYYKNQKINPKFLV